MSKTQNITDIMRIFDLVMRIKNKTASSEEIQEFISIGYKLYRKGTIPYPEFYSVIETLRNYRGVSEINSSLENVIYNYENPAPVVDNTNKTLDSVNFTSRDTLAPFIPTKNQLYAQPTNIQNTNKKIDDLLPDIWDNTLETDLTPRGKTMMGRDYIRDGNRNYKHMRAMLERLWEITREHPGNRFSIDDRFAYDRFAIANYIAGHFRPEDVDNAHRDCIHALRKRGRPPGARNRDKVMPRQEQRDPFLDNIPQVSADDMSDDELIKQLTEDKPNVAPQAQTVPQNVNLKEYVKHIELEAKNYATKSEVFDFTSAALDTVKNDIAGALKAIQDKQSRVLKIEQAKNPGKVIDLGLQHEAFPKLLKACCAVLPNGNRVIPWVYGPAGTGKSYGAEMVAKALDLLFYSMGTTLAKFEVLGFINTSGYQRTPFRDAYENGGVFCGDEMDSWSKEATIALNNALANGECAFPDKTIKRHKDFVMVATANTIGNGATLDYVARTKQDAATMDRFGAKIFWKLDEVLEYNITSNKDWLAYVRKIRHAVERSNLNPKPLITPRASVHGSALLDAGLDWDDVVNMTVKAGLTDTQWEQLQRNVY